MDQNDPGGTGPNGGGPVISTDHERTPGAAASIVPSFLAELTRAMQATAEQERERIAAVVAEEAAGQVDTARARAAIEAEELRRLAEQDVGGIRAWAADETERIRQEASRRTDERRKELEAHLAKHDSLIASEIAGVDVAVIDYRATLDRFFDELRGATDPADIARRAGSLPMPPDLDEVRATARANAVETFANAPEDVADEPPTEEAAEAPVAMAEASTAVEAPVAMAEATEADATPAAAEDEAEAAGEPYLAPVMAADAADASDAEAGTGVMDPDAVGRTEELPVDAPVEEATAATAQRSSAAVRMLRSIAPWTLTDDEDKNQNHGSQGS
jgi:hypothetical protein